MRVLRRTVNGRASHSARSGAAAMASGPRPLRRRLDVGDAGDVLPRVQGTRVQQVDRTVVRRRLGAEKRARWSVGLERSRLKRAIRGQTARSGRWCQLRDSLVCSPSERGSRRSLGTACPPRPRLRRHREPRVRREFVPGDRAHPGLHDGSRQTAQIEHRGHRGHPSGVWDFGAANVDSANDLRYRWSYQR